jgi:putative ABC transport system permease protein
MISNYLHVAWRNLKRNKVFSVINILGLSVGLCVCMLVGLYIWHETNYDNYHPHVDRLYQVATIEIGHGKESRFHGNPHSVAGLLKSVFPQVEATARMCGLLGDDKTLLQYYEPGGNGRSFNEDKGYMADSGFFHLFKYNFVEGNAGTAISGPYSIVLSSDIAAKLFGQKPAIGKTIHVSSGFNGDHDYTVTAVFQPAKMPSHIDARFFLSIYGGTVGDFMRTYTNMASNYFFYTYVLLKPGVNPIDVERQFPAFVETYEGKDLKATGYYRKLFLLPVKDIHLYADMQYGDVTPGGSVTYLYILGSIALFTLLIACINFMNLATARSSKRSAEVGVRKTLGAGRLSLIWRFLGESLFMAFIAFVVSLGLTYLLLPAFNGLSGKTIFLSSAQVTGLGAGFFLLVIFTGLLAGSYPALYLSSFKPVKILKGKITNSLAVVSLRKGLVVFQFCISIVLIVAAAIISKQMHFLRNTDLGFNKDQELILPLRSNVARKLYSSLKNELQKNPGIRSVGASFNYPGYMGSNWTYYAEGKASNDNHNLYTSIVDFDFLKTLQIQPVAGHIFTDQIPSDSVDGAVLNQKAVELLGYNPATCIGKRVYATAPSHDIFKIVGVVKDFHFEDLHVPINGVLFMVNSNPVYSYIIAHINSSNIENTIAGIQRTWQSLNPNEPFEYSFLDEQFQRQYDADNRLAAIVGYTTGIAILISCLGLFGLAAFSAEQRTKEIGIRKVLGAGTSNLVALLSFDFLKLVGIAIVIGMPLGWWATNKWLRDFAYRTPVNWWLFAFSALTAMVIAFATISFQAFRAATSNPVESLRTE